MANSWFAFKQFTVMQDKAAMKVGTDGVLLGAWVDVSACKTILDVGTGTGLLTLMAAQRNADAHFVAVDIDRDAALQAEANFKLSEWQNRLRAVHTSLSAYADNSFRKFDCVMCNPPFFKNAFKSDRQARNTARHNDSLSYNELLNRSAYLTNAQGRLAVIVPFETEQEFLHLSSRHGFFLKRLMRIQPTPDKDFVRSLIEVSKCCVARPVPDCMVIEDKGRHSYSDAYIELTKDYYLAF